MSDLDSISNGSDEVNGDVESSEDFTPDYSALNTSLNEPEVTETTEETSDSRNPAWDPILDLIPEQLHSQVIPHLSKTDKHVQELQQRYAPYKSFIDQGISPDVIDNSLTLGQMIAKDPQAVITQMQEQFGLTRAEAEDLAEDFADDDGQGLEYGDEEDSDFSGEAIESHPLVQQLQAQVQELAQAKQEQQMQEMQSRIADEVRNEWAEVEKQAGGRLPQHIKDDIAQRALSLAGDNGIPSLMSGFKAHVQFASQIRNSSANNSAPSVADGTGLLPTSRTYDKSTPEGRQAYIADFARSISGGK